MAAEVDVAWIAAVVHEHTVGPSRITTGIVRLATVEGKLQQRLDVRRELRVVEFDLTNDPGVDAMDAWVP